MSTLGLILTLIFGPNYRVDEQRMEGVLDKKDLDMIMMLGTISAFCLLPLPFRGNTVAAKKDKKTAQI